MQHPLENIWNLVQHLAVFRARFSTSHTPMLMASGSFFHMATLPVTRRLWRAELVFAEGSLQVGLVVQERDCDLGLVRVFRHLPVALVLEQCPTPRLIQWHKANQQAWNQHSVVMHWSMHGSVLDDIILCFYSFISFIYWDLLHLIDFPITSSYILSVNLYFCIKKLVTYREEEEIVQFACTWLVFNTSFTSPG